LIICDLLISHSYSVVKSAGIDANIEVVTHASMGPKSRQKYFFFFSPTAGMGTRWVL